MVRPFRSPPPADDVPFGGRDLSRAGTLNAQRDLETLCQPRPLVTNEIFEPNAMYGQDVILKAAAGLPVGYPLKIAIPHGVETEANVPFYQRRELVPVLTYHYVPRRPLYEAMGVHRLWPLASPFLYADRLVPEEDVERSGTILFPSHSNNYATVRTDFAMMADAILDLPEDIRPLTVCMYWWDLHLGHHQAFLDRGVRVVSAGHPHDPLFLVRLRHLCRDHAFVASDHLSSASFYAMAAGCRFTSIGAPEPTWDIPLWTGREEGHARMRALVGALPSMAVDEQRAVAMAYLGGQHLLSSADLRRMLERAERLDTWGLVARTPGGSLVPEIPARFRRLVRRATPAPLARRLRAVRETA